MILKDFRTSLEDVINNSRLSIDMIYFVLKDVLNEVEGLYKNVALEEEHEKETTKADEEPDKND